MTTTDVIGRNVRELRKKFGLTQRQFCAKVGLSNSFISDLENGKRSISAENLHRIADEFQTNVDWFFIPHRKGT